MLKIRGPRVVAALVIGAALAAAGAAYQNMFRNPLVSPDILGVSAGAAVGAVLGIFLSLNVILIQSLAFAFGLAAVGLVYVTANAVRGHDPLLVLVLAGVVVGSLLGACVALMKYLADPYNQLPAITFWLLGSIASASPADVWSALPLMLLGLAPMWLLRWRINLLSLDDEEARALGVETGRIRFAVIAAATLMTSAAVAISGVIGWIGLVIPHFARMLVGPDFARLLPTSILLGAGFLLGVDTLARTVARIEIPLGVLTAFVGTPLFLWQLATARRSLADETGSAASRFRLPRQARSDATSRWRSRRERCCACSARTAAARRRYSRRCSACCPSRAERCSWMGWICARAGGTRSREPVSYVPQAHAAFFPYTVREVVLMGRTAHLGVFATPSRRDHEIAEGGARAHEPRASRRIGIYAHLRGRAAARRWWRGRSRRMRRSWSWTSRPPTSTSATRCGCSSTCRTSRAPASACFFPRTIPIRSSCAPTG